MTNKILSAKPKSSIAPWIMAMRPKTFGLFMIPMIVGTLLAPLPLGQIQWSLLASSILSGMFIVIGMHFINETVDFKKGVDTEERLGPVRVTQKGWLDPNLVFNAGLLSLAVAVVAGLPLVFHGGVFFLWIILTSCLLGFLYTGGPAPISYLGIGEPLVLVFYGWVATIANYFLQMGDISYSSFIAGTQMGLLCTVLLAINNLRDHKGDAKANKKTLAVRWGVNFAKIEIGFLVFVPFLLSILWVLKGYIGVGLLPWLSLPLAILLMRGIISTDPGKEYNQFFIFGVLLHLSFSLLLILAYRMTFT